jgi:hypothetical protein
MTPDEQNLDMLVAELDRENRLLRARNDRLERENECMAKQVEELKTGIKRDLTPVAGQCRFECVDWSSCSVEHVRMVLENPQEWARYEVRYLYAEPPAKP